MIEQSNNVSNAEAYNVKLIFPSWTELLKTEVQKNSACLIRMAEQARLVVFEAPLPIETIHTDYLQVPGSLDLPFSVVAIEIQNDPIGHFLVPPAYESRVEVWCIIVEEISPTNYQFAFIGKYQNRLYFSEIEDPHLIKGVYLFTEKYINFLNSKSSEVGLLAKLPKAKLKSRESKRQIKFYRPIYVRSKTRSKINYVECSIGAVDWSHAWEVRGHWRKTDGLGKNREGQYVVSGFTWVSSHVKGNVKAGVVKKTRWVA